MKKVMISGLLLIGLFYVGFNLNTFKNFEAPVIDSDSFTSEDLFLNAIKSQAQNPAFLAERGILSPSAFIPVPPRWYAYSGVISTIVSPEVKGKAYISVFNAPQIFPKNAADWRKNTIEEILAEGGGSSVRIQIGPYEWVDTTSEKEQIEFIVLKQPAEDRGIRVVVLFLPKGDNQMKEKLLGIVSRMQWF